MAKTIEEFKQMLDTIVDAQTKVTLRHQSRKVTKGSTLEDESIVGEGTATRSVDDNTVAPNPQFRP